MSLHDIEARMKRVLEPFPFVKRIGKRTYQYVGYALSGNYSGKAHIPNQPPICCGVFRSP